MTKKPLRRRVRLSGMMDTSRSTTKMEAMEISDTSVSPNISIPISRQDELAIRKMLRHSPMCRLVNGDAMRGNAVFDFIVKDEGEDEYRAVQYEFRVAHRGTHTFMSAFANPTKLISGKNSKPVLVTGLRDLNETNRGKHTAFLTFQLANRLGFILLDYIPSAFPFTWSEHSKKAYVDGDMIINQYQYAWYSGALSGIHNLSGQPVAMRTFILHFLRACFGGSSMTNGMAENLGKFLNVATTLHEDSDNLTLSTKYSKSPDFSLTLYAKDRLEKKEEDKRKFETAIRFDCTMYSIFWKRNKIDKVRDLEAKYRELCEAPDGKYDTSFTFWLAEMIMQPLYMEYIISMTAEKYQSFLNLAENDMAEDRHKKLVAHWYSGGDFSKITETCQNLKINPTHFRKYADEILVKHGLNVEIPIRFHRTMLVNRVFGLMTEEQQNEMLKPGSNRPVDVSDLISQDTVNSELVAATMKQGFGKVITISPIRIPYKRLWVFEKIKAFNEGSN